MQAAAAAERAAVVADEWAAVGGGATWVAACPAAGCAPWCAAPHRCQRLLAGRPLPAGVRNTAAVPAAVAATARGGER